MDAPIAGPGAECISEWKEDRVDIGVRYHASCAEQAGAAAAVEAPSRGRNSAKENITILIATGLHRLATQAELDEILSPAIASTYRIVNHNARELSEHRFLGNTKSGTPVYVAEDS